MNFISDWSWLTAAATRISTPEKSAEMISSPGSAVKQARNPPERGNCCMFGRTHEALPVSAESVYIDGRARPTIYTLSADTGRTSCVRPNSQQSARSGGFRAGSTADPAELFISADFYGVAVLW